MPDPRLFKIFLSSPGDVPTERDDAQAVIDEINASGEFTNHFILKLYRWDDRQVVIPMAATDIPQKSVDIYMTLPSACDLTVVLFWSRMGSPLVMDGREYLSGTHYEYSEAREGYRQAGKPAVWLYRCAEEPSIRLTDPQRDDKIKQFDNVIQFFKQFQDEHGRYTGGVNGYATHRDFKALFKGQLLTYLRHLRDHPRPAEVSPKKRAIDPNLIPYRGLTALDERDAPIFFGRERETLDVLSRIDKQRVVFVLGASGSGKSSLAAAGVLPKLRERGWAIVRCVPGEDPFYALALALLKLPEMGVAPLDALSAARRLADVLRESPANLVDQIGVTLPGKRVLLFIDQFEEVFTLAQKNPRLAEGSVEAFLQAIRYASGQVVTLLTLRADFYAMALAHFEELKEQAYGLTRPSPFALYEMISRPAELAGLRLDDGLAVRIVEDAGSESGALALISYVLEALYLRAKARGDGQLTRHDYEVELKGVRGVVNTLAERAYAELPFDEAARERALQAVFRELIALTEEDGQLIPTRRRARLSSFSADSHESRLIDTFVHARLLVKDTKTVEVAHEALFRSWERLRDWIAEAQEDLILLRQVRAAAEEWVKKGRPGYLLWPQERLALVDAMIARLQPKLNDIERDFTEPEQSRLLRELEALPRDETSHERRRDIGDRLAVIGDTRPGVGVKNGLPDIVWLPVFPGGEIKIDRKKFTVQPFYIAKYLVTYEQYQAFVEAEDGFKDPRWWEGMPDEYKHQALYDQMAKIKNAPRDNVSWYQAVAFGRWVNHRCKGLVLPNPADPKHIPYVIGENAEIRLPTEWEWQWMAQGGSEQRNYSWGGWRAGYANTGEAGLSRTTTVGMYPHGAAVCSALDVVGNLWEWCLNNYETPDIITGFGNGERKVLRGGSFYNNRDNAAASYRGDSSPDDRYDIYGFRFVACPY